MFKLNEIIINSFTHICDYFELSIFKRQVITEVTMRINLLSKPVSVF